jgi:hypothetical protein
MNNQENILTILLIIAVLVSIYILICVLIMHQNKNSFPQGYTDSAWFGETFPPPPPPEVLGVLQTKHIVFLCLVRDAMPALPANVDWMQHVGNTIFGGNFTIYFLENHSTDGTREYLNAMQGNNKKIRLRTGVVTSDVRKDDRGSQRIHRMCALRNQLLDFWRQTTTTNDMFAIMMDADLPLHIHTHGLLDSFEAIRAKESNISAVSAVTFQYPLYAPFKRQFTDPFAFKSKRTENWNSWFTTFYLHNVKKFRVSYGHEPVHSNYGGLTVYRASKLMDPKVCYVAKPSKINRLQNEFECEHVTFHENFFANQCIMNHAFVGIVKC